MRYVISYDLLSPGKNYQTLYSALAGLAAQRILLSQWVTRRTGTTAQNLATYIAQYMDANDRLLVASLDSADWYGFNLMMNVNTI